MVLRIHCSPRLHLIGGGEVATPHLCLGQKNSAREQHFLDDAAKDAKIRQDQLSSCPPRYLSHNKISPRRPRLPCTIASLYWSPGPLGDILRLATESREQGGGPPRGVSPWCVGKRQLGGFWLNFFVTGVSELLLGVPSLIHFVLLRTILIWLPPREETADVV